MDPAQNHSPAAQMSHAPAGDGGAGFQHAHASGAFGKGSQKPHGPATFQKAVVGWYHAGLNNGTGIVATSVNYAAMSTINAPFATKHLMTSIGSATTCPLEFAKARRAACQVAGVSKAAKGVGAALNPLKMLKMIA